MLYTVLLKEAKQLFSDKGFLLISLIQPIVFIIMFGSSFQGGDINHLDTIIINDDNTNFSNYVVESTNKSEFFDIVPFSGSLDEALEKLDKSEIRAVIFIPKGFGEKIDNTTTSELKIYIDSSNFLTYSSLSGAKIEIAKDTLQNITNDVLKDLEKEKEKTKEKIDIVKKIFESMETETDILDDDLNDLKKELNDLDFFELKDSVDNLKTFLKDQIDSLNKTQEKLNQTLVIISGLQVLNETEEQKKVLILSQISDMKNKFRESISNLEYYIREIDGINISSFNSTNLSMKIEDKLNNIKNMFEDAKSKSDNINLNFEKLQRNFLSEPIRLDEIAYHGSIRYFDYLGAGVLSLIIFFVGLMAPALNIISEKEKNTLYRISTTPASSITLFLGKFIVFMIFSFFEMLYTLLLAIIIYDLRITGSILDVVLILTLLACSSISLGLFISSRVKTMQQALVIVPLIVIPSFLISHAFFPPDVMAEFMNYVAYLTPMTFSNHALNAIMIKGFTLSEVINDIYALIVFTIVPLAIFIWSYKRIKY